MRKKIILAMVTAMALVLSAGCGIGVTKSESKKKAEEKSGVASQKEKVITMPITFVNNTNMDIYRLYASSTGTDDWEEDILGDAFLEPGEHIEVDFSYSEDETTWDFAIEDEEENMFEYYDMDFEDYGEEGISIFLNEDGTADIREGADSYQTIFDEEQDAWKDYYIDYINANQSKGSNAQYTLVYIDDDAFPELYIDYGNNAAGGVVCSYHCIDGKERFEELEIGVEGSGYVPRGGIVCYNGGSMGYYQNIVYVIEDGEFLEVFNGEITEDDGNGIMLDNDGEIIYNYYMDGVKTSGEEYFDELYCYCDIDEVSLFADETVNKKKILSIINAI